MVTDLVNARPYVRAIFNLAYQTKQLALWQDRLQALSSIVNECQKGSLLNNPCLDLSQQLDLFAVVAKESLEVANLVKLLAKGKKLLLLPEIASGYQQLFWAQEKILMARVVTAVDLDLVQKEQLLGSLARRYPGYRFLLKYDIDHKLIGGAIIYFDGQVIDGSVRGFLTRLQGSLLLRQ